MTRTRRWVRAILLYAFFAGNEPTQRVQSLEKCLWALAHVSIRLQHMAWNVTSDASHRIFGCFTVTVRHVTRAVSRPPTSPIRTRHLSWGAATREKSDFALGQSPEAFALMQIAPFHVRFRIFENCFAVESGWSDFSSELPSVPLYSGGVLRWSSPSRVGGFLSRLPLCSGRVWGSFH